MLTKETLNQRGAAAHSSPLSSPQDHMQNPSENWPQKWGTLIKQYRQRQGLTQKQMAAVMDVSQRTISRWERGEDQPSLERQKFFRDLGWQPPSMFMHNLSVSIKHCPIPRALSRSQDIRLVTLSQPAIDKRPSVVEWVGRDLAPIACGVLADILEDKVVQNALRRREISCLVATTRSVLDTAEHAKIGAYQTTISYFYHDGDLYSDAISVPVSDDAPCGYEAFYMDNMAG